MTRGFNVSPVTDAALWEALFAQVAHPHMLQSWAYGEAKQTLRRAHTGRRGDMGGWRTSRFVFEHDGEALAICQVFDKPVCGIRCVSRLSRGPLFLGAEPGPEVTSNVYRALKTHWGHRHGVLLLAPALLDTPDNYRMLANLGFRARNRPGACSDRVDLRHDVEQLRQNLSPDWRRNLRKAEASDLEVRVSPSPEDLEWIIARHTENMREKGFVGPSPALLRALHHAAGEDFLILQARLGDEAVGGQVVYRFGRGAELFVAWAGREGRKVNVGNLLYWRAAIEMRHRRCLWLDLGGVSHPEGGYGRFKRGMHGEGYRLLNEWLAF